MRARHHLIRREKSFSSCPKSNNQRKHFSSCFNSAHQSLGTFKHCKSVGTLQKQKSAPGSKSKAPWFSRLSSCSGQSTVEYLIVGVALLTIIAGLGALSGRLQEGLFVEHAADSASHSLTTNTAGSAGDILLY